MMTKMLTAIGEIKVKTGTNDIVSLQYGNSPDPTVAPHILVDMAGVIQYGVVGRCSVKLINGARWRITRHKLYEDT